MGVHAGAFVLSHESQPEEVAQVHSQRLRGYRHQPPPDTGDFSGEPPAAAERSDCKDRKRSEEEDKGSNHLGIWVTLNYLYYEVHSHGLVLIRKHGIIFL